MILSEIDSMGAHLNFLAISLRSVYDIKGTIKKLGEI